LDELSVVVPLAFATAINDRHNLLDKNFINYLPTIRLTEFENFVQQFDYYENNFLIELGFKETTFGKKFKGAIMNEDLAKQSLTLHKLPRPYITKSDYEKNFPYQNSKLEVVGSADPIDLATTSATIMIARNNRNLDFIVSYPHQSNNQPTIILMQECKSTFSYQQATSPEATHSEIKSEYEIAKKGFKQMFPENANFKFIFAYTSNCTGIDVKGEDYLNHKPTDFYPKKYPDAIIVVKENWTKRFSPMFVPIAIGEEEFANLHNINDFTQQLVKLGFKVKDLHNKSLKELEDLYKTRTRKGSVVNSPKSSIPKTTAATKVNPKNTSKSKAKSSK